MKSQSRLAIALKHGFLISCSVFYLVKAMVGSNAGAQIYLSNKDVEI